MATPADLRQLASTLATLATAIADQQEAQPPAPTEPQPRQMPARVMFTAEEAAEQLGIGRTMMYRLLRDGDIESVRIGRLRRVPASAIQDYAARLVSDTATQTAA
ncbi:helix-turn-helix domain-containing protein [Saccharomonospora sp. NPDC006951]